MVTTMAFAADLTASAIVRTAGDIVSIGDVSKAEDTFAGITESAPADQAWKIAAWGLPGTYLKLSVANSDDKSGADIATTNLGALEASLWIKPVEDVKLTFLSAEIKSTNDYAKVTGDFGVTYTGIPSLTVDVVTTADHKKNTSIDFGVKAAYAIDNFGTINGIANYGDKLYAVGFESAKLADLATVAAAFEYADKAMKAYEKVTLDIAPVTVMEKIDFNDLDKTVVMKSEADVSGKVGDVSLELNAKWADLQKADKVVVTPSAEIGGNVGAAAWTLGCELPVDMTGTTTVVSFAIPYSVSMAW